MKKQNPEQKAGKMSYLRYGNGEGLLIAIPGYGDRAVLFEALREALSDRYRVYALELPQHGASTWSEGTFGREDFEEAIRQIMEWESTDKISLMGYSFGGRVVLSLMEKWHPIVKEIFLVAPDGFNKEYISRATFLPKSIRGILQAALKNPRWYVGLAKLLHRLGLLRKHSYWFVQTHMATEKRRKRLFLFWNSIADFSYDEDSVKDLLEKNNIPVTLVLGRRDSVIPSSKWAAWSEGSPVVKLHWLEEGHRLVGNGLNDFLSTNEKENHTGE
ncbi:MAG TPA: alpha/beta fold hydrolase [Phaeodactylibacter sp.]|nr:alpha/beta fold hydrolase [Phaeodactylibacter sp.]